LIEPTRFFWSCWTGIYEKLVKEEKSGCPTSRRFNRFFCGPSPSLPINEVAYGNNKEERTYRPYSRTFTG
jgi:hypothetical protein